MSDNNRRFQDVYLIGKEIGRGHSSTVHIAIHSKTSELVAVKIIVIKNVSTEKEEKQIKSELDILKTVKHPNIVAVKDIFEAPEAIYIVMELIKGGELFGKINYDHYTEKDASVMVGKMLSAIQYIHGMNITHRDLKPENILLSGDIDSTDIKICDFGLSKIISSSVTKMSTQCGTIHYVAPEVLRAAKYDQKVDIWSLGVIAYFLLCGFPPFLDESYVKVIELIVKAQYDFPGNCWASISEEAKDFIRKILVLDSSKRLTATEALQHPWIKNGGLDRVLGFNTTQVERYRSQRSLEKHEINQSQ